MLFFPNILSLRSLSLLLSTNIEMLNFYRLQQQYLPWHHGNLLELVRLAGAGQAVFGYSTLQHICCLILSSLLLDMH